MAHPLFRALLSRASNSMTSSVWLPLLLVEVLPAQRGLLLASLQVLGPRLSHRRVVVLDSRKFRVRCVGGGVKVLRRADKADQEARDRAQQLVVLGPVAELETASRAVREVRRGDPQARGENQM